MPSPGFVLAVPSGDQRPDSEPAASRRGSAGGASASSSRAGAVEVSAEAITQFRTSLLARRFPGLQGMSDAEVADIIAQQGPGSTAFDASPRRPKGGGGGGGGGAGAGSRGRGGALRAQGQARGQKRGGRAPFSPCNPERAREEISRHSCMLFSGIPVPYEADKEAFLAGKNLDERKRLAQAFAPNSASQAADSISYRKQPSVPSNGTAQLIQELSGQMHLTGSLRRAVLGIHNSFEEQTQRLLEQQASLRPTAYRRSRKGAPRTTGGGTEDGGKDKGAAVTPKPETEPSAAAAVEPSAAAAAEPSAATAAVGGSAAKLEAAAPVEGRREEEDPALST